MTCAQACPQSFHTPPTILQSIPRDFPARRRDQTLSAGTEIVAALGLSKVGRRDAEASRATRVADTATVLVPMKARVDGFNPPAPARTRQRLDDAARVLMAPPDIPLTHGAGTIKVENSTAGPRASSQAAALDALGRDGGMHPRGRMRRQAPRRMSATDLGRGFAGNHQREPAAGSRDQQANGNADPSLVTYQGGSRRRFAEIVPGIDDQGDQEC